MADVPPESTVSLQLTVTLLPTATATGAGPWGTLWLTARAGPTALLVHAAHEMKGAETTLTTTTSAAAAPTLPSR